MSSYLRLPLSTRAVLRGVGAVKPAAVVTRPFSVAAVRALKEDDRHRDDQGARNEAHKQDQLEKAKKGTNHAKPELMSNSEEAVKADKHDTGSIKEMQDKTAKHAEEQAKAGTSQTDPFSK